MLIEQEYAAALADVPDGPAKDQVCCSVNRRPAPISTDELTMASFRVRGRRNRGRSQSRSTYRRASPATTTSLRLSTHRRWAVGYSGPGPAHAVRDRPLRHHLKGPDSLPSKRYQRTSTTSRRTAGFTIHRERPTRPHGLFWFEPFGIWNDIATTVLAGTGKSVARCARSGAHELRRRRCGDRVLDAKYHFRFWRPYTAIRRASEDDNNQTEAEPEGCLAVDAAGRAADVLHSTDSRLSIRRRDDVGRGRRSVERRISAHRSPSP